MYNDDNNDGHIWAYGSWSKQDKSNYKGDNKFTNNVRYMLS
jgi:hypothetical protein